MSDLINLTVLSPETAHALKEYGERCYYDEWLRTYMQPERFAWLIALLKAEPDSEDLFPQGKWATIQRLEGILATAAECEVADREETK